MLTLPEVQRLGVIDGPAHRCLRCQNWLAQQSQVYLDRSSSSNAHESQFESLHSFHSESVNQKFYRENPQRWGVDIEPDAETIICSSCSFTNLNMIASNKSTQLQKQDFKLSDEDMIYYLDMVSDVASGEIKKMGEVSPDFVQFVVQMNQGVRKETWQRIVSRFL